MTRLLDVLEDYLYYKNYSYERIDGNIIGRYGYTSWRLSAGGANARIIGR
jgi:hypothetical protein